MVESFHLFFFFLPSSCSTWSKISNLLHTVIFAEKLFLFFSFAIDFLKIKMLVLVCEGICYISYLSMYIRSVSQFFFFGRG